MSPSLRAPFAVLALALVLPSLALAQAQVEPAPAPEPVPPQESTAPVSTPLDDTGAWEPDRPEPGSVEQIREFTTAPEFLPETVSYVPDSDTVPSPTEFLGHLAGAPDELSRVAQVHGYFRALDAASDRVQVQVAGTSEEGREILLVLLSDAANLADLGRYREITGRLADPRATSREDARRLAGEGKLFYYLLGGLHSPETGSPEMLMELAYRLAVSEKPEIRAIRENAIVLITPVVEPDGRDRMVDWYYRHVRGRDLPWEELSRIDSPPYWGHYVFHDNNRDGIQITQALTRAVNDMYWAFRPQVMHDLHESVPLLYISTGHGPYSRAVDPVTISEWTQLGQYEAGALAAQGLPGVWTWGFWDGWWPGYLVSVANNHHGVGRFYETFGNTSAGTFERDLSEARFVGKPVTEVQWYRPWPPGKKVRWSLRNNTNYMQAAVLEALGYAALHRRDLLESFWIKGARALEKGGSEAPYAWIFPPEQRDFGRLAHLVNQLRAHHIEIHRLTGPFTLKGRSWPAGSYVVRMDQPYRNAAVNFLEEQRFPADEPNPPYDDVAWTFPLIYGVEGTKIDDRSIFSAAMEPVAEPIAAQGGVTGAGEIFLLRDTGQTSLLTARLLLAAHQVDAAEASFQVEGLQYPAGSWIVQAPREAVEQAAARLGLTFTATAALPDVRRHLLDLPRLGLLHTWISTQDAGWARYTLDQTGVQYELVSDTDLRRGGLSGRFDVLLFPNSFGSFAAMVHGLDPKYGPLAYTRTDEFPSHGTPNASEDITGGMGFEGLSELQRFVRDGGVLIALANAGTLVVDGGLTRDVERVPPGGFNTPGSEVRAKVLRPEHPIAYGYEEIGSVFRGNGPLWDVDRRDRRLAVLQFGTKKVEEDEDEKKTGEGTIEEEEIEDEGSGTSSPAATEKGRGDDKSLVLSGFLRGEDVVDGKPAILDVPVGKGRVLLYAFNPLHRYLNLSDFRFVWNALLNWNDLP